MDPVSGLTVTIARHGQTTWNAIKRIQGQLSWFTEADGTIVPVTLSEKGVRQAGKLAIKLRDTVFTHCFTSDLKRAVDTVEIVMKGRDISILQDPRLRERSRGKWEGKFESEYSAAPADQKTDTETDESMCNRLFGFLNEKAKEIPQGNVLILGHERVITNIFVKVKNLLHKPNEIDVKHTGTITLRYTNNSWELTDSQGIMLPGESK